MTGGIFRQPFEARPAWHQVVPADHHTESTVEIVDPPAGLRWPVNVAGSDSSTSHPNLGPGSWSCTKNLPGLAAKESSKIE